MAHHCGSGRRCSPELVEFFDAPSYIYKPFGQSQQRSMTVLVRTTGNPTNTVSAVRDVVRQMDPGIALQGISTLEEEIADSIAIVRLWAF